MAYTKNQLECYFQRIEYTGSTDLTEKDFTEETLSAIQKAHLEHIPYENIDILRGVPLSLTEEGLFDKMVTHRRGGYCFEQNGLLYFVLSSLGFQVTQYCGRFILGETGIADRRHRVLRVHTPQGDFICDVGVYGESPRKALRFEEGLIQEDGLCHYRYDRDPFYGWIEMQQEEGKPFKPIYGFTEEEWLSRDFVQPSFFCEKHPESAFSTIYKVGIFKDDLSLTLIDHTFTVYAHGKIQSREDISDAHIPALLKERFNLSL